MDEPHANGVSCSHHGGQKGQPCFDETIELAAVVGSEPLPRPQVVKKVWEHIKKEKLQNPANKREIVADDKLRAVFGKDKVSMFEMNEHLAQHLR